MVEMTVSYWVELMAASMGAMMVGRKVSTQEFVLDTMLAVTSAGEMVGVSAER